MLLQWDNPHEGPLIQAETVAEQQGVGWGSGLQEGGRLLPDCKLFAVFSLQHMRICKTLRLLLQSELGEIFSYRVRGNLSSDVTTLTRCLEILQRLPDIPLSSPSWIYSFIAPF